MTTKAKRKAFHVDVKIAAASLDSSFSGKKKLFLAKKMVQCKGLPKE